MNFTQTLQMHLTAIKNRDLTAFLATISQDEALSLIMPNGQFLQGRSAVAEMHQAWFADPDWQLETEVLRIVETAELNLVLLLVDYNDIGPDGQPYTKKYYLSLVFAKRGDNWLLIHDQNTFI